MRLQCNIDSRGKRVRLVYGIVLVLIGILLTVFWAVSAGTVVAWVISLGLLVVGAFMVFESRSGWCALRAMGFKTPI